MECVAAPAMFPCVLSVRVNAQTCFHLISFLASEMSSGRISHILITVVTMPFLLPAFQKPQIPLQLCLLLSCSPEGWCL